MHFEKLKVLFAGTPELSIPTLEFLYEHTTLVAVLCAPDSAQGRSKDLLPCAVKQKALELNIKIFDSDKLDQNLRDEIKKLEINTLISFAYGKIFGPKFLSLFAHSMNIHPSKLPTLRGPSPLFNTLKLGFNISAISYQTIALGMDEGEIIHSKQFEIPLYENYIELEKRIALLVPSELPLALEKISNFQLFESQSETDISYCHFIRKDDGIIDWSKDALEIHNLIRACASWPIARTKFKNQEMLIHRSSKIEDSEPVPSGKVLRIDKELGMMIGTGKGCVWIETVQLPGKKPMHAAVFSNGARDLLGSFLGDIDVR